WRRRSCHGHARRSLLARIGRRTKAREPTHTRRGVEGLRHRDEGDLMFIERLDQLGEVSERARQAIDFVDDDHIPPALLQLGEEKLQGWTLERSARQPTIVIALRQKPPALMGLTFDVGLAGFTLGIE